eukprot:m.223183 g.223183  ORF g.223183 m.223183 type:complete len:70 (-) comp33391_c5_seq3:153-362(-)
MVFTVVIVIEGGGGGVGGDGGVVVHKSPQINHHNQRFIQWKYYFTNYQHIVDLFVPVKKNKQLSRFLMG